MSVFPKLDIHVRSHSGQVCKPAQKRLIFTPLEKQVGRCVRIISKWTSSPTYTHTHRVLTGPIMLQKLDLHLNTCVGNTTLHFWYARSCTLALVVRLCPCLSFTRSTCFCRNIVPQYCDLDSMEFFFLSFFVFRRSAVFAQSNQCYFSWNTFVFYVTFIPLLLVSHASISALGYFC